jgi:hypothetical protein
LPSLLITEDIGADMQRIFLCFTMMNRSRSVLRGVQKAHYPKFWDGDDQKVLIAMTRMGELMITESRIKHETGSPRDQKTWAIV